jgi:hypothetical protein
MVDTLGGASKRDVAIATIIGVFILIGATVAASAFTCTDSCPTFNQGHFDRFVDLVIYLGFAGALYIGIRSATNATKQ